MAQLVTWGDGREMMAGQAASGGLGSGRRSWWRWSKRTGVLGFLGVIVVLFVATSAIGWGSRQIEAPWSIGGPGKPTLTGTWAGPLRAQQGAEYRLYLDLQYNERGIASRRRVRSRSTGPRSTLVGTGRLCTQAGATYDLDVSRGIADRTGQSIVLRVSHVNPHQSALWIEWSAAWQGDRLALQRASNNPFLSNGTFVPNRTISSADPPDPFAPAELRKASRADFEASCRQLAGRR